MLLHVRTRGGQHKQRRKKIGSSIAETTIGMTRAPTAASSATCCATGLRGEGVEGSGWRLQINWLRGKQPTAVWPSHSMSSWRHPRGQKNAKHNPFEGDGTFIPTEESIWATPKNYHLSVTEKKNKSATRR